MTWGSPLTRRHLIGGLGAAGVATATGVGLAGAASAAAGDQGGDGGTPSTAAQPEVDSRDLANPIVQTLGSIDFQPADSITYAYVNQGGVMATGAAGTWFNAGLRLPVGATITGTVVYLDPNGVARDVRFSRYNPLTTATFEILASATSTTGTVSEAVPMPITHTVEAGWNYRFDNIRLNPAGAILYGAQVTYTIPPDPPFPTLPTGFFVPFAGPPRVYDSRTGAGKLAANQERVIPLGVPGTVKAAVFNITVTETETAGFVACFKADIPWPGNSSVNWYEGGANTANLVICAVDAAGAIKIRCGNDDTHVVIDMIGMFV